MPIDRQLELFPVESPAVVRRCFLCRVEPIPSNRTVCPRCVLEEQNRRPTRAQVDQIGRSRRRKRGDDLEPPARRGKEAEMLLDERTRQALRDLPTQSIPETLRGAAPLIQHFGEREFTFEEAERVWRAAQPLPPLVRTRQQARDSMGPITP